jgi:hypothetical protein
LLYSIYTAKHWDTQNIVETLLTSEVIAYAAAPRLKVSGPSDSVEVDYGEPGRPAYVPPAHEIDTMEPPAMDAGLAAIAQRVSERISKSTLPRVLQTGDFPANTPFATLNLATQSGIKALAPYKELAEDALAEVFTLMLNWLGHSGQALEGMDKPRRGQPVRVEAAELAELRVDVELTADVPVDRMARINAASMAVRELGYSRERALEQIGEADAHEVMRQAEAEAMDAVEPEIRKQRRLAAAQAEDLKKDEPAGEVVSGQGFNPAAGGTPPAMAGNEPRPV